MIRFSKNFPNCCEPHKQLYAKIKELGYSLVDAKNIATLLHDEQPWNNTIFKDVDSAVVELEGKAKLLLDNPILEELLFDQWKLNIYTGNKIRMYNNPLLAKEIENRFDAAKERIRQRTKAKVWRFEEVQEEIDLIEETEAKVKRLEEIILEYRLAIPPLLVGIDMLSSERFLYKCDVLLNHLKKQLGTYYSSNARLIWNGQKNALADVFYQLKKLTNKDKKPLLDASNELIAEFLKANFECFKDTQLSTIREYLEKDEKRPRKGVGKIILSQGFSPEE